MVGENKIQKNQPTKDKIPEITSFGHEKDIKEDVRELRRESPQKPRSYVIDSLMLDAKKNKAIRKKMLLELENILGSPVISYVQNRKVQFISSIQEDDEKFMADILYSVPLGTRKINLILSSLGGDPDTALKQVQILRDTFPEGFNVIIPQFAKSAATIISLGANKIIMGQLSELGPIDPIMIKYDSEGESVAMPAKTYLGSILEAKRMITTEDDPQIREMYLKKLESQVDFQLVKTCKDWLKTIELDARMMLEAGSMKGRTSEEINSTITNLISGPDHLLHASIINATEASNKLKLNVELWNIHDVRFKLLWEYYMCAEALFNIENVTKLYESANMTIMETYETEEENHEEDSQMQPDKTADTLKVTRRQT